MKYKKQLIFLSPVKPQYVGMRNAYMLSILSLFHQKEVFTKTLKVPKCEIFHLFDFYDVYDIKSL